MKKDFETAFYESVAEMKAQIKIEEDIIAEKTKNVEIATKVVEEKIKTFEEMNIF